MEFVIYLYSIINSDKIRNLFTINYRFHMKLVYICNQLLIPIEFVTHLQSIINFHEICNLFSISYQFL